MHLTPPVRRNRHALLPLFTRISAVLCLLSLCLLGLGLLIDFGWSGVMFILYLLPVCAALTAFFGLSLLLLALGGTDTRSDPKRFFLRRLCPGFAGLLLFAAGTLYCIRAVTFIFSITPIEI